MTGGHAVDIYVCVCVCVLALCVDDVVIINITDNQIRAAVVILFTL